MGRCAGKTAESLSCRSTCGPVLRRILGGCVISKHERRFTGFDDKIVAMYARGMTVREIQGCLTEAYAVEVSPGFTGSPTDAVMAEAGAWQAQPLEPDPQPPLRAQFHADEQPTASTRPALASSTATACWICHAHPAAPRGKRCHRIKHGIELGQAPDLAVTLSTHFQPLLNVACRGRQSGEGTDKKVSPHCRCFLHLGSPDPPTAMRCTHRTLAVAKNSLRQKKYKSLIYKDFLVFLMDRAGCEPPTDQRLDLSWPTSCFHDR